jgi:hypothetical protein
VAAIELASNAEAMTAVMTMRARRLAYLAEAQLRARACGDAERLAQQALSRARDHEPAHEPQALYILAESARRRNPADVAAAANHYREALERAERLGLAPLVAACRSALEDLARRT